MIIKTWILSNLFNENTIISSRMTYRWFKVNSKLNEYTSILAATSFLMSDAGLGQRVWHILNDKLEIVKCSRLECNMPTKFHSYSVGYSRDCSGKCAQLNILTRDKIKKTNIKKYGVEHVFQVREIKEKCKNTIIEKYGVDNISKSKIHTDKKIKTCLENYGVNWILCDQPRKEAAVNNKYGVKNIQQVKSIAEKRINTRRGLFFDSLLTTNRLNNLAEPLFTRGEYVAGGLYKKYNFKCKTCNTMFEDCLEDGDLPRCTECYKGTSIFEKEVCDFIKTFINVTDIIENDKKILNGLELDIYIPSKNIAIECDGLFWHGEIGGGKNKKYHLDKTNKCEIKNIRLIHIFEDEWINNKDLVKSKLKHIIGNNTAGKIHARKCIIREILDGSYIDFIDKHHIQGADRTSNVRLGAYYNNNLVAVSTFGKLRKCLGQIPKNGEYELYRFCIDTSYIITGIGGRLMKHFINTYHPKKIISYADRRWTFANNNVYNKLGFTLISTTVPNYWYFGKRKNYKRYHRFGFRKDKLANVLPIFDPLLSEWKNMRNNKWDRIWDCGNFKYELNIT